MFLLLFRSYKVALAYLRTPKSRVSTWMADLQFDTWYQTFYLTVSLCDETFFLSFSEVHIILDTYFSVPASTQITESTPFDTPNAQASFQRQAHCIKINSSPSFWVSEGLDGICLSVEVRSFPKLSPIHQVGSPIVYLAVSYFACCSLFISIDKKYLFR